MQILKFFSLHRFIIFIFFLPFLITSSMTLAVDEYPGPCDGIQSNDSLSGKGCTSLGGVKNTAKEIFKDLGADTVWDVTSDLFGKLYDYVCDFICWLWDYKIVYTFIDKPGFCIAKSPPPGVLKGQGCISLTSGSYADPLRISECCDPNDQSKPKNPPCVSNLPVRDIGSAGERLAGSAFAVAENIEKAADLINLDTLPVTNNPNAEIAALGEATGAAAESSNSTIQSSEKRKGPKTDNSNEKSNSKSKNKFNLASDSSPLASSSGTPFDMPTLSTSPLEMELENLINPHTVGGIGEYHSGVFGGSSGGSSSITTVENPNASAILIFGENSDADEEVNPMGSEDPDDYFTRISRNESLFKRVHDRYQMHALLEMKNKFQKK